MQSFADKLDSQSTQTGMTVNGKKNKENVYWQNAEEADFLRTGKKILTDC